MRSHGFRNQQETSISQMLKCELLLLFMSIILPSLYWELDPRSPINCTASLAVLDPVRLVLLLALRWGEALDLLLTAPTLCLPRDPLAALRSGFHSQEPQGQATWQVVWGYCPPCMKTQETRPKAMIPLKRLSPQAEGSPAGRHLESLLLDLPQAGFLLGGLSVYTSLDQPE